MDEPQVPQKSPYVLEVQPGSYAWCACGRSRTQPYCDGSHRGTAFRPIVIQVSEARRIAWCGCKHSGGKPFCDGSHRRLA